MKVSKVQFPVFHAISNVVETELPLLPSIGQTLAHQSGLSWASLAHARRIYYWAGLEFKTPIHVPSPSQTMPQVLFLAISDIRKI